MLTTDQVVITATKKHVPVAPVARPAVSAPASAPPGLHQRYPRLTAPPVAPPTTATVRPLMPQESRRCTEATSVITPDLTATVTASRVNDSTQGKRGLPMSQLPPARSRGGIAVWAVSAGSGVSSVSRDYTR
jgi:hypothetical protein